MFLRCAKSPARRLRAITLAVGFAWKEGRMAQGAALHLGPDGFVVVLKSVGIGTKAVKGDIGEDARGLGFILDMKSPLP